MDAQDVVVTSRGEERFSASVEQVEPIYPPGLEQAPSPARLQVHFDYITQHQIFFSSWSTRSIYSLPSSLEEDCPTLIHHYEDPVMKLRGEFDLQVLLSTDDELGANFSPFLSQFEITQGSEEHTRILGEIKRVGREIGPERKNLGLFALQVSILRVYTTYRCESNPERDVAEEMSVWDVIEGQEMTDVIEEGEMPVWDVIEGDEMTDVIEEGEMLVWDIIEGEEMRVTVRGEEICSVCLEEFRSWPPCTAMPCSHVFHSECIRTWLARNERSCPLCRFQMPAIVEPSFTYMFHLGLNLT